MTPKQVIRGFAGAMGALFLGGAVGSLAAPHAGIAQCLGVCWGSMILGAVVGSR